MHTLKKIAIVGRPNVGKSSLFNAIIKKKVAIVDEEEGITRDRIYRQTELFGYPFEVIDTGGIDAKSKAAFNDEIRYQAKVAIEEADSIILVVDGTLGVHALDQEVAKILRKTNKPLTLAINKVDNPTRYTDYHLFASLGIPTAVAVSALHGVQIAELLEKALHSFDKNQKAIEKKQTPCIAICGRPNVGKSTLLNSLLDEERSIVSPLAGTTRDTIDTDINIDGKPYTLIDTAGIRRRHKERDVIEKFAHLRTEHAIERSNLCLVLLDAQSGITTEEKKIIRMIEEAQKGCILLFNKWDLVKGFRMEHCLKGITEEIPFLAHCPKLFISAATKRNLDKIFPAVNQMLLSQSARISTGRLNKMLIAAMQKYHPPAIQGKRLRIYYMAQVDINPPHFVLFVNNAKLMVPSYKRYLMNEIRDHFQFNGIPLMLTLRSKDKDFAARRGLPQRSAHRDKDLGMIQHVIEQVSDDALSD